MNSNMMKLIMFSQAAPDQMMNAYLAFRDDMVGMLGAKQLADGHAAAVRSAADSASARSALASANTKLTATNEELTAEVEALKAENAELLGKVEATGVHHKELHEKHDKLTADFEAMNEARLTFVDNVARIAFHLQPHAHVSENQRARIERIAAEQAELPPGQREDIADDKAQKPAADTVEAD